MMIVIGLGLVNLGQVSETLRLILFSSMREFVMPIIRCALTKRVPELQMSQVYGLSNLARTHSFFFWICRKMGFYMLKHGPYRDY